MSVLNIDEIVQMTNPKDLVSSGNHPLFPQHSQNQAFRWLISGASGTGKTNLIVSALIQGQILFDKLYLYTSTPEQPKYQLLIKWINTLEKRFEKEHGEPINMLTIREKPEDVIPIEEIDPDCVNICIIDDLITAKNQEYFANLFIRGRHRNLSCVYLTQSYFKVPTIIREQCNYITLFGVNSKQELVTLAKEHSLLKDYDEFKEIFQKSIQKKTDFFLIDRSTSVELLQHRRNWDNVWLNEQWVPVESLL